MINGAHILIFSDDSEADRDFLRDVLGFKSVDVGHGWLIFKLPPAEVAVHPTDDGSKRAPGTAGHMARAEVYLMCDDLKAQMKTFETKGVSCAPVQQERWGMKTSIRLPSGAEIGLYQPSHKTALGLG
ncbi:MAG TPA: VOC family protein [Candidatus Acidoferrales bacterium]|nr:VOC family protein [Candidatus Acidoferrales bacterium]